MSATRLWNKDLLIAFLLFAVALGLYSIDWKNGFIGGVSTVGATRVLSGDVPYLDFWTMYAPGQFYLLATLFRLFGTHFLVEVISASVICAAASSACYILVRTLTHQKLPGVLSASIFFAATYNTGYFKNLGSYPPAILLLIIALTFVVAYYKEEQRLRYLMLAGLATGVAVLFKHDVAGYSAVATVAGLIVAHLSSYRETTLTKSLRALSVALAYYLTPLVLVTLPAFLYLWVVAGRDMWQDIVVFPLTDFRFVRPEHYPSLLPLNMFDPSFSRTMDKVFDYLVFALPFMLFLVGVLATAVAWKRRRVWVFALGITFSLDFLFHYSAAHVQINTHIISMSLYGALLGILAVDAIKRVNVSNWTRVGIGMVGCVWLVSISAKPVYSRWTSRNEPKTELKSLRGAGIKLSPRDAGNLDQLAEFVEANTTPGQHIFVGLHRHDVIVQSDLMLYFILNRSSATRYEELHPAIADNSHVQREIITDLQRKHVSLIILAHMFPDSRLEVIKKDFLRNVPYIGATDLDQFIHQNYLKVRQFGRYEVWQANENVSSPIVSRVNSPS